MVRFHRPEDRETPTVEAAEGFERCYGEEPRDDEPRVKPAGHYDPLYPSERRALRQAEREGRAA
jgi:hypothetical protein